MSDEANEDGAKERMFIVHDEDEGVTLTPFVDSCETSDEEE